MRATTEFFRDRDNDKVIPPGEGVMGVTLREGEDAAVWICEQHGWIGGDDEDVCPVEGCLEGRAFCPASALTQAEKERDKQNSLRKQFADELEATNVRLHALEKERDEAIEAHEEMTACRDDLRDEKWDEYLNEKCAELVKERDEARRELAGWSAGKLAAALAQADERLEKVREALGEVVALASDALNETASEGERCETCGSDQRLPRPRVLNDDATRHVSCPDPFHTASEGEGK